MSSEMEKAKQKRKNRNRWMILFLIWVMVISLASGVSAASNAFDSSLGRIIAICILGGITLIYWLIFIIVIRRDNQKGN